MTDELFTAARDERYQHPNAGAAMKDARGWLGLARLRQELLCVLQEGNRVADVGGGSGDVAVWLSARGFEVWMSDIEPNLVRFARKRLPESPVPIVADARHLPYADKSFEVVLALGPLYHLERALDRVTVLRELRRVATPGGLVVVEFMGRENFDLWSAAMALGNAQAHLAARGVEQAGVFENREGDPSMFTTCFTHDSTTMNEETREAGFTSVDLIALQGPFWPFSTQKDGSALERSHAARLLSLAARTSRRPSSVALSPHGIAILR